MNLLPHIFVLDHIRKTMEEIKQNPFVIEFILGGLQVPGVMIAETYGAQYIDQAIKAFQSMEWHYCLGYRLDVTRLPNISVMMDGGTEGQQFIGDYGHLESKVVPRTRYGSFTADSYESNQLVVQTDKTILSKIWRTQKIVSPISKKTFTIIDISDDGKGTVRISLDGPLSDEDGLIGWEIYGASSYQTMTIGESLDRVTVKVYADVVGDPELCEIINCVLRYIVKQARIPLTDNGLNTPTVSYRPIARNDSYPNQNVWTSELTITGQLTDQWILATINGVDSVGIGLTAVSRDPHNLPVDLTIE